MTDEQLIQKFTQDVYLTRYNRFIDEIPTTFEEETSVTDTDAIAEIVKTAAWLNMFLDELERETDPDGRPVNWSFVRENDVELGTVTEDMTSLDIDDDDILRLVVDDNRPLTIAFDGTAVSTWEVVSPNQITKRSRTALDDRVTVVNRTIIFSRAFKDFEVGGTIIADVINKIPRLVYNDDTKDAAPLNTVVPYELMVLGVAKNATLPDIVQGGLSPSFVQKYADLLDAVKLENQNSSVADSMARDDNGYIGGIY